MDQRGEEGRESSKGEKENGETLATLGFEESSREKKDNETNGDTLICGKCDDMDTGNSKESDSMFHDVVVRHYSFLFLSLRRLRVL